jgi:hypothetical protein
MRNRRAFRPQAWDMLEDRLVPSLASVPPPIILLGHTVPLPPQVQVQDNPQVSAAFDAFIRSYTQAIDTVLLAPGPRGSAEPSANREAFDAVVKQALTQVREAFGAFLDDYFRAVRDVLLAMGPDGRVDASANRSGFDARVAASLRTLNATISAGLQSDHSAPDLTERVRDAVLDSPGNLAGRLASLPTPAGSEAATVRDFTLSAFRAIVSAFSLITADLSRVVTSSTAA